MGTIEHIVEVDAPVAAVWTVLEEVGRLPDLSPGTVSVEGPARLTEVGQTFQQTVELGGRRFTSRWEVVALEPQRHLTVSGHLLPGVSYELCEAVTPVGPHHTQLHISIHYKLPFGPLGRLANRLGAESRVRTESGQVARAVAEQAEAIAAST